MAPCSCFACQHPDADNAGQRAWHRICHVEFGEWLAARAPFTAPSPRALVVMTAGEMWVSGRCHRPADAGLGVHPVHRA